MCELKILITQARVSIAQEFGSTPTSPSDEAVPSRNPEMEKLLDRGRGFDPNFYRKPVGWLVLLALLLFFILAWIFIELA